MGRVLAFTAYGFDVVAVRIEHECAVVIRMVLRANARLSVVTSACPYRGPIERVDEAALRREKCNVRRTSRLSLADPEVGPRLCTHPDCLAEIHDHFVAERRQRGEE